MKRIISFFLLGSLLIPLQANGHTPDQHHLLGMTNARTISMGDVGLAVMSGDNDLPVTINLASVASCRQSSVTFESWIESREYVFSSSTGKFHIVDSGPFPILFESNTEEEEYFDQITLQGASVFSTAYANIIFGYCNESTDWALKQIIDTGTVEKKGMFQYFLLGAARGFFHGKLNVGFGVKLWNWSREFARPELSFDTHYKDSYEFGLIFQPLEWLSVGGAYGTRSKDTDQDKGCFITHEFPARWGVGIALKKEDTWTRKSESIERLCLYQLMIDYSRSEYKEQKNSFAAIDAYDKLTIGVELRVPGIGMDSKDRWSSLDGLGFGIGGGYQNLALDGIFDQSGWHLGFGVSAYFKYFIFYLSGDMISYEIDDVRLNTNSICFSISHVFDGFTKKDKAVRSNSIRHEKFAGGAYTGSLR